MCGDTPTLEGLFIDETSNESVAASNVSCYVYKDGVLIHSALSCSQVTPGRFTHDWETLESLDPGLYVYVFKGKFQGKLRKNQGVLRLKKLKGSS